MRTALVSLQAPGKSALLADKRNTQMSAARKTRHSSGNMNCLSYEQGSATADLAGCRQSRCHAPQGLSAPCIDPYGHRAEEHEHGSDIQQDKIDAGERDNSNAPGNQKDPADNAALPGRESLSGSLYPPHQRTPVNRQSLDDVLLEIAITAWAMFLSACLAKRATRPPS
ncbi:hypothetical protein [Pseudomonas sp. TE50-2]|uniref:hypothetical protein n=1 Tax=Pseudomonas sp. TE50-2 TaxID=3142707 RepID=UPI00346744A8